MDDEVIPVIEDSDDADLARRIVTAMEAEFQLTMPPIEASYLLLHIKGAKIRYHDSDLWDLPSNVDESELLRLIDDMIEPSTPVWPMTFTVTTNFSKASSFICSRPSSGSSTI